MRRIETKGLLIEFTHNRDLFQANCVFMPQRGWLCSIYKQYLEERGNAESGPLGLDEYMMFYTTYECEDEPSVLQLINYLIYEEEMSECTPLEDMAF